MQSYIIFLNHADIFFPPTAKLWAEALIWAAFVADVSRFCRNFVAYHTTHHHYHFSQPGYE